MLCDEPERNRLGSFMHKNVGMAAGGYHIGKAKKERYARKQSLWTETLATSCRARCMQPTKLEVVFRREASNVAFSVRIEVMVPVHFALDHLWRRLCHCDSGGDVLG